MTNEKFAGKPSEQLHLSRKEELLELKEEIICEVINRISKLPKDEEQHTSKQICTIYNISSSTLERFVRSGLKFRNTGKKTKRLFTKAEFENYLKKQNYGRRY
ncbi:helix-turn-helix domain-containing protein [Flavobacterium sp. LB3P45]|uniref:Helix-turn-helix domain-containing protein n=1 Tax=Flavobacterium fructosi TaxID=3230416 RepID=A0ABW6HQB2_9FLAO